MTRLMDGNVSLQTFFQADLGYTHNKVDNNNTFSGLANWTYGLHYNFPITGNFKLLAGGVGDFNGGFVYNPVSYTHLDVYKRQPLSLCEYICLKIRNGMIFGPIRNTPADNIS